MGNKKKLIKKIKKAIYYVRLVIIIGHFQSLKSCGNKQVLIKPVKSFELIFKWKETEINMEGFLRGLKFQIDEEVQKKLVRKHNIKTFLDSSKLSVQKDKSI